MSKLIYSTIQEKQENLEDPEDLITFLKSLKTITIKLYPLDDFQHSIQLIWDIYELLLANKHQEIRRSLCIFISEVLLSMASGISSEFNCPVMKKLSEELLHTSNEIIGKKKQNLVIHLLPFILFSSMATV